MAGVRLGSPRFPDLGSGLPEPYMLVLISIESMPYPNTHKTNSEKNCIVGQGGSRTQEKGNVFGMV